VLGRKLSTLFSGTKTQGEYLLKINSEDYQLSSGVYFIRMTASSLAKNNSLFQKTIKIVLTK